MSKETRRTKIIHLLADPSLTQEQIAQVVGCSRKTVQRVAADIKPAVQEVEGKLGEYQMLLKKRLPIRDRVELYERIARKAESNPFAAMRALERADELDGILTDKDRVRGRQEQHDDQPMFILPPGSNVCVNVITHSPHRRKAETTDPGPGLPAIDIKAEQNEES